MGTHINFNSSRTDLSGGNRSKNQTKPMGNSEFPLARQSSLYSLTFDELQNTLGEPLKDFGSMNMDELLKNIWTGEETQAIMTATSSVAATGPSGCVSVGSLLQRQGSLTLPRTLSQKTVDEVWKYLISKQGCNGDSATDDDAPPERQLTLGEMTLEDFLLHAGVVREDNNCTTQQNENSSSGFYANNGASTCVEFGFGQPNQNSISFGGNNSSMILNQTPGLDLKVGGTMQQQQPHQRLPPTIFPKQADVTFAAPANMVNGSLFEAGAVGPVNNNRGLAAMGGAGVTVAATSPGTSSAENNTWSSPVPYMFGRGRRINTGLEKVVERRQKRMIKNRESATRSRARKQAYTLELEAEIENLKQLNQDLQRKQAEIMKTQKNEPEESSKQRPWLAKMQCLRRTLTGPW